MNGKLTPKRRAFVLAYMGRANGNATEAARLAGYAQPHPEGARLLQNATVATEIAKRSAKRDSAAEMDAAERRALLAAFARGDGGEETRDRLKAIDMLAKMGGDYLPERLEVSGPDGGEQVVRLEVTLDVARERARLGKDGGK